MEVFELEGIAVLARWAHILSGITWVGLLYYFNFVQVPFMAGTSPDVRATATRQLVPRALWWFRFAALATILTGASIITIRLYQANWLARTLFSTSYGVSILTGMTLGTIMFLNVWMVIWPKQKVVLASAEAVAGGAAADPRAGDYARRAFLVSRTNVVFSIPMVFFMATSAHLQLFTAATFGQKFTYAAIAGALVLLLELNALTGLTGSSKRYLESVPGAVISGFILWAAIYLILSLTTPGGIAV